MKGIILAGGSGTRLYPVTQVVSKQLLPVYDKPMIYYPLSVLMQAGVKDILLISTSFDIKNYEKLLGDGSNLGIKISYATQENPNGIAQAFLIGEEFIGKDSVALILGDNIFYGQDLGKDLEEASKNNCGGTIFVYYVKDANRYGIVEFDNQTKAINIEEKPKNPKSNWAVTGLYFYDNDVIKISKGLRPSWRNELEITDVNNTYLKMNKLKVKLLGQGYAWLDTGTPESLIDASTFIRTIEERQGLKIGCIEEIAYKKGYINAGQLRNLAERYKNSKYGEYLLGVSII